MIPSLKAVAVALAINALLPTPLARSEPAGAPPLPSKIASRAVMSGVVPAGYGAPVLVQELLEAPPKPKKLDLPPHTKIMMIKVNVGGVIRFFDEDAKHIARRHIKVIVDGVCASSCTRFLFPRSKIDICATKNAIFAFHMPFIPAAVARDGTTDYAKGATSTTQAIEDSVIGWNVDWAPRYPEKLRAWLDDHTVPNPSRGQWNMLELSAEHAWALGVKKCEQS